MEISLRQIAPAAAPINIKSRGLDGKCLSAWQLNARRAFILQAFMLQAFIEQRCALGLLKLPDHPGLTAMSRLGAATFRVMPLFLFVGLWQALSWLGFFDQDILPSPVAVGRAFVDMAGSGELVSNLLVTLRSAFTGLFAGAVCGVALGMAMATSPVLNSFFGPLIKATYSLPKSALVPLLILWFGVGTVTNTITVALAALLPIVVYTFYGIRNVPRVLIWSALSMGTPKGAVLRKVVLPVAMRSILIGFRIALGFSYVLAIAAEMIASNAGIGKLMFGYGQSGSYDYMFAAIGAIVMVAFISDRLVVNVTAWILRWDEAERRAKA
jgi:ABC-type nitrate/sulfonate/bicarbonate transport system permease component